MRIPTLPGLILSGSLAHLAFAAPASAFMLVPDPDGAGIAGVLIEREYGDVVELAYLPKPYDRLFRPSPEAGGLAFRWLYRKIPQSGGPQAQGRFVIDVDPNGRATARFEFFGHDLADGAVYAAAAALLGPSRKAVHTFYARAGTQGGEFDEEQGRVLLTLERPPAWWDSVAAIAFFYMQYPHGGELGAAGVGQAMRRAVGRLTLGAGDEQEE